MKHSQLSSVTDASEQSPLADALPKPGAGPHSQRKPTPSPLPLEWTRVQRKRKLPVNASSSQENAADLDEYCCDDASCRHVIRLRREQQGEPENNAHDQGTPSASHRRYVGKAIFLLHDSNPDWIQGYFFPNGAGKPWGLLAIQQDIDECLQCTAGGYRVVQLTILPFDRTNMIKKQSVAAVEWIGGDMMCLKHPLVQMQGEQLVTGEKAVPTVETIFATLLTKLRSSRESESTTTPVLKLFPDLAIVSGTMQILMPYSDVDDMLW
jgi:hypothetical protein